MNNKKDNPSWWAENQKIRDQMGLAEYEPPRFADHTYTHKVVTQLEEKYNCSIYFLGVNTQYPDKWEVWINGEQIMYIPHQRDKNGNTIYDIDTLEFIRQVENSLSDNS